MGSDIHCCIGEDFEESEAKLRKVFCDNKILKRKISKQQQMNKQLENEITENQNDEQELLSIQQTSEAIMPNSSITNTVVASAGDNSTPSINSDSSITYPSAVHTEDLSIEFVHVNQIPCDF